MQKCITVDQKSKLPVKTHSILYTENLQEVKLWRASLGSVVKHLPANARDAGSIAGSGRSPGEGNGNPLQYSCLGNPMDRGVWRAAVRGVTWGQT